MLKTFSCFDAVGEGTLGNEPCFLASKQTPASPEAVYATPDVNSAFVHHKTDDLAGAAKALEAEFQQATLSVAKAVIRPSR